MGVDSRHIATAGDGGAPDREAIRAGMEAIRVAFRQLLDDLAEADWRRRYPGSAWTVGELLTHLTWSLELVPREVEHARRGKGMFNLPPLVRDPLSMIATRGAARGQTRQSIAARYESAHAAALRTLDGVKDDEWHRGAPFWGEGFRDIEGLFRAITHHFDEHAAHVRQVAGRDEARAARPEHSY